jgi:arylsulfatase A-like enzyme
VTVELRDIFPSFLDAAGALTGARSVVPKDYPMDGDSMLCLLDPSNRTSCRGGAWRPWLDLEHTICYNATNHWNALVDGEMKYIFNAYYPSDATMQNQLFNLTEDPHELRDLARSPDPAHAAELKKWQGRW